MSMKGEKYKSKSTMKKHEKKESYAERVQEYGAIKAGKKVAKKAVAKKVTKKK